ncbi:MAG TPA: hypothetical protein P5560_11445 [Thermotogota bacterium]|nr:hypothetical protein [Thermotogota bacterium]HRW93554.1 hypothetical protein [Thermotogota bacterium]
MNYLMTFSVAGVNDPGAVNRALQNDGYRNTFDADEGRVVRLPQGVFLKPIAQGQKIELEEENKRLQSLISSALVEGQTVERLFLFLVNGFVGVDFTIPRT